MEQPVQHTEQGENQAIMEAIDDLVAEIHRISASSPGRVYLPKLLSRSPFVRAARS